MRISVCIFIVCILLKGISHSQDLSRYKDEEEAEFINYADRTISFDMVFNITSNDLLFDEGYYSYKLEDYENALRKMEDYLLVCTNPDLREYALFVSGISAIMLQDYQRALTHLEGISYLQYMEDYRHYFIAYALFRLKEFDRAEAEIDDLVNNYPATILVTDAELLRLDLYIAQNRYRDIISQSQLILELVTNNSANVGIKEDFLIYNIAKAYLALGDKKYAKENMLKIFSDYPTSIYSQKIYDLLTRELQYYPDVNYRMRRADNLFNKNLFQNALNEYLKIKEMVSKEEGSRYNELRRRLLIKMADSYLNVKNSNLAKEIYSQLYEDNYYSADMKAYFLYRLAQIAKQGRENSEAIRLYEELARRYPRSKYADEARYLSIWLRYNDGKFDEAISGFKEFVNKYKKSPRRLDALWFLGLNLFKNRRYEEAYKYLYELKRTALNSEDKKPASIYFLAKISCILGKRDECRGYYINLIENFPLNYYSFLAQNRLKEIFNEEIAFPDFEPLYDLGDDSLSISEQPEKFIVAQEGILRFNKALQLMKLRLEGMAQRELSSLNVKISNDYRTLYFMATLRQRVKDYKGSMKILRSLFVEKMLNRPSRAELRFWKRMFPIAYFSYVRENAQNFSIDPLLILSIMREESHFNPISVSPAGAIGLMQIMPKTGRLIASRIGIEEFDTDMLDIPEINIRFGSWYLSQLLIKFGNQLPFSIAAYNAGPAAMDRWLKKNRISDLDLFIEEIPYKETRNYVKKVLQTYGIYNYIYRNKDGKNLLPLSQSFDVSSTDNIDF